MSVLVKVARTHGWLLLLGFLSPWLLYTGMFEGQVLQGVDENFALRTLYREQLLQGVSMFWHPEYWLGYTREGIKLNLGSFFLLLFEKHHASLLYIFASMLSIWILFAFFRRLGVSKLSALFGAFGFAFSPHFLTSIYSGHPNLPDSVAPVALLMWSVYELFYRTHTKRMGFVFLFSGAVSWSMLISNIPQRALYFSVFAGAWVLYGLWMAHRTRWKDYGAPVLKGMLLLVMTLILSAQALFLWTHSEEARGQATGRTSSEEKWNFATQWSYSPRELVDLAVLGYHGAASGTRGLPYHGDKPFSGNHELIGFFVLFFACFAVCTRWKEPHVRFFGVAGFLALLLAFGRHNPGAPLYWLWWNLPFMDKFRVPSKFLSVVSFASVVLSVYGMEHFQRFLKNPAVLSEKERFFWRWGTMGFLLLAVGMLLRAGFFGTYILGDVFANQWTLRQAAFDGMRMALIQLTVGMGVFVGIFWMPRPFTVKRAQMVAQFITVLSAVQIMALDQYYISRSYVDIPQAFPRNPLVRSLQQANQEEGPGRIAMGFLYEYRQTVQYLSTVASMGYDITYTLPYYQLDTIYRTPVSRMPDAYTKFFQANVHLNPQRSEQEVFAQILRFYRLTSTREILADESNPVLKEQLDRLVDQDMGLQAIGEAQHMGRVTYRYRVQNALPRYAWFTNVRTYGSEAEVWQAMQAQTFEPSETALLETNADRVPFTGQATIAIEDYQAARVDLNVQTSGTGLLVNVTAFDPFWAARVNGVLQPIQRVNGMMQGLVLSQGQHQVRFFYDPPKRWLYLSLGSFVAGCVAICFCLWREKQQTRLEADTT